jgi:hypothetical protein
MASTQQTKKLLNADVLGEFEQGIEMLVLAQRLAIDFNFERRFHESIAEQGDRSRGVVLPGSPEKSPSSLVAGLRLGTLTSHNPLKIQESQIS